LANASKFAGPAWHRRCTARLRAPMSPRRRQTSRTIPDHASTHIADARLDAYAVIAELARGGMSTVYLGQDLATGEHVAIKALDAFHVGHSDMVRRLLGEHE